MLDGRWPECVIKGNVNAHRIYHMPDQASTRGLGWMLAGAGVGSAQLEEAEGGAGRSG